MVCNVLIREDMHGYGGLGREDRLRMPDTAPGAVALCAFCGAPLKLLENAISVRCMVCGERGKTRTWCTAGHFVCDGCRGDELMGLITGLLDLPRSTDPVETLLRMRQAQDFPMHGPEHHGLVAAAFLLAYHDLYGEPDWEAIVDAVQVATRLPGGTCGFWGACSAGLAVGIAYCTILNASPTDGPARATAHQAVARILERLGEFAAPRCCRRDSLLSLQVGCELSAELLPRAVSTSCRVMCDQVADNPDCIGLLCPFAPPG